MLAGRMKVKILLSLYSIAYIAIYVNILSSSINSQQHLHWGRRRPWHVAVFEKQFRRPGVIV